MKRKSLTVTYYVYYDEASVHNYLHFPPFSVLFFEI
jgi:hypothetical protein